MDLDRLVKVHQAVEGISERVNSRGKNKSLKHRVPEGVLWEIGLGLKFLLWLKLQIQISGLDIK